MQYEYADKYADSQSTATRKVITLYNSRQKASANLHD